MHIFSSPVGFVGQLQELVKDPGAQRTVFNRLVNVQADTLATDDVFWISAIIFILLIPVIWITKPTAGVNIDSSSGAH